MPWRARYEGFGGPGVNWPDAGPGHGGEIELGDGSPASMPIPRTSGATRYTNSPRRLPPRTASYPSSKTCSGCGWVKGKLTLSERNFNCGACGLLVDRDLNAARNLANLTKNVAQSGWETRNARGVDVRPGLAGRAAMKREAGTGHGSGKAGTVDA